MVDFTLKFTEPQAHPISFKETPIVVPTGIGKIVNLQQYSVEDPETGEVKTYYVTGEIFNDLSCNEATGKAAHAEGRNNKAIGDYSHVENVHNIAYGYYSHAEGITTRTYGKHSHAEGKNTIVFGDSGHIEGYSSRLATDYIFDLNQEISAAALRSAWWVPGEPRARFSLSLKNFAHCEGIDCVAYGESSHAEGRWSFAEGPQSHAEGNNTYAKEHASHAEGVETEASGVASHAEGLTTKASGRYSHAEGQGSEATGDISHAGGHYCIASGDMSDARGYKTVASGTHSHARGVATTASGKSATASGSSCRANGENSTAMGFGCSANKKDSVASGENCLTYGDATHAFGYGVSTGTVKGQVAVGQYNKIDYNAFLVVGNGTSNDNRSNAFVVLKNGSACVAVQGATDDSVVRKDYVDRIVKNKANADHNHDASGITYNGQGQYLSGDTVEAVLQKTSEAILGLSGKIAGKADGGHIHQSNEVEFVNKSLGIETVHDALSYLLFQFSEVSTALDAILSIQNSLMIPNGDEVAY